MKHSICLFISLFISSTIYSQTVAWELSGEPGNQASSSSSFQAPNFDAATLGRGAGIAPTSGAGSINASGWFSGSAPTTLQDAIDNDRYYEFTITRLNCHFIDVDSLHIVLRSSATGPNTVTLRSSTDGFFTDLTTRTVTTTSVKLRFFDANLNETDSTVTFRLYGYGAAAGGGTPAAGGTMRIGSSANASDNDLIVFAKTQTLEPVLSVPPSITVNTLTNIPTQEIMANSFGLIKWERTPEVIGVLPLSGASFIFGFTSINNTGAPLTSTFSAFTALGSCRSPVTNFSYTVNPAPPATPCSGSLESWELSNEIGDQVSTDAFFSEAGIGTGTITYGSGVSPAGPFIGGFNIKNWYDGSTATTIDDAIAGNKYYEITVPVNSATTATVTSLEALMRGNGGAPRNLALRSSNDNFTSTIATAFLTTSISLKTFSFPAITQTNGALIFRIYAFGNTIVNSVQPNPQASVSIGYSTPTGTNDLCIFGTSSTSSQTCAVTNITLTQIEPCQNNGTPNDPSDDFYFADVNFFFENPPTSGFFQTTILGGSQNFMASSVAANGSPFKMNNKMISVNGGNITGSFLDASGCSLTVAIAAAPPCPNVGADLSILDVDVANQGPCNNNGTPANVNDDFYVADIVVQYQNFLNDAGLSLAGSGLAGVVPPVVANGGNTFTHTFFGVKIKANGAPAEIEATICAPDPNDPNNTVCAALTVEAPAIVACSGNMRGNCEVIGFTFDNIGTCDDNNTPTNPSDDFFEVDVTMLYSNPTSGNTLQLSGNDIVMDVSAPAGVGANLNFTFVKVKFKASGQITDFMGTIELSNGNICHSLPGTGPSVNACATAQVELNCPDNITVNCSVVPDPDTDPDNFSLNVFCDDGFEIEFIGDEINPGDCIGEYTILRTYKATGCFDPVSCVQEIQVVDNTKPSATCPAQLVVACAQDVPPVDPGAVTNLEDNCGTVTVTLNEEVQYSVECANKFIVARTFRIADDCGNASFCTQFIQVKDSLVPSIICPGAQSVSCANTVPAANINAVNATDNCSASLTTVSFTGDAISNQICANRFTITRTYRATDACGNSATCSQIITVNDQTAPALNCPANQTVSCASQMPAPNTALVTGVSDNCGGTGTTVSFINDVISNQTCANRFTLTRSYRATDVCGNSATCVQTITVNDQTAPMFTFVPASTTVDCYLIPAVGNPTAADNCNEAVSIAYLGEVKTPGICPVVFTLTRSWRATDVCGNSSTASQVISVTDTNAPNIITAPLDVIAECHSGNMDDFNAWVENNGGAVAEDCGPVTWSFGESPFHTCPTMCGNTFQKYIRFTATDQCGNTAFRDAKYIVVDFTAPIFTNPPKDQSFECQLDCDGEAAFYEWLEQKAWVAVEDNCGETGLEIYLVDERTGCGRTWWKTYEFRATDQCGNTAKTRATFSVVDNMPPDIQCPPNNWSLSCVADLPAPDPTGIVSNDACSPVSIGLEQVQQWGTGCASDPMSVFYTYVATDECGNKSSCVQQFLIRDNSADNIILPDTIYVSCVEDIPGPDALDAYLRDNYITNCDAIRYRLVGNTGLQGNQQTYSVMGKDACNNFTNVLQVSFAATGSCNALCSAKSDLWGEANSNIGGISTQTAVDSFMHWYGAIEVGALNRTLRIEAADCFFDLLGNSGNCSPLPAGHHVANGGNGCALPDIMLNSDGSLNSSLVGSTLALQLNIWYNKHFNQRDLGIQDLRTLPDCAIDDLVMNQLGTQATWQDLLSLANTYLSSATAYPYPEGFEAALNAALSTVNLLHQNCTKTPPCQDAQGEKNELRSQNQLEWSDLQLSPNPANNQITMQFHAAVEDNNARVYLISPEGRTMDFATRISQGNNSLFIDLQDFNPGVYQVSLRLADQVYTARFVKIRP